MPNKILQRANIRAKKLIQSADLSKPSYKYTHREYAVFNAKCKRTQHTQDLINKIIELTNKDLTTIQIAERLGKSRSYIDLLLTQEAIKRNGFK